MLRGCGLVIDRRAGVRVYYRLAPTLPAWAERIIRLAASASAQGFNAELLSAVENVNTRQKLMLFDKIRAYFDGDLTGKTIAVWGLSFKPNTDDMREASSRVLIEALWREGCTVRAYDPVARAAAEGVFGERDDLVLCERAEQALEGADALAIVTEWREFRSPDFDAIKTALRTPVIFDGRNLYDPAAMLDRGIRYFGIGRGESANLRAAGEGSRRAS